MKNTDCREKQLTDIIQQLTTFIDGYDYIYLTIDMDVFSSAYAPGVSAPSPVGITPSFFWEILQFILTTKKVISCDVAELNPKYDEDHATANLVARIIDFITLNRI